MAAMLSYKPGSRVTYRGRTCVILRTVSTSTVMVEETATGTVEVAQVAELSAAEGAKPKPVTWVVAEPDRAEAKRRLDLIRPALDAGRGITRVVKEIAKTAGVHPSTVFTWIRQYRDSGRLDGLAPQRRGRRMPPKLSKEVQAVIQSVIDDFYLTTQQPTATRAIEEVARRCRAAGLKPPHANSIRRRFRAIPRQDFVAKRRGRKEARDKFGEVKGEFPDAQWPLQTIQIDHTPFNVILVDEEHGLPIGRPWLTVAIDVFSRMVVGYHLSLDHPSAWAVGLCLCHAFLFKDAELDRMGIKGEWPVWGIMRHVHADNGKDFRSVALQRACDTYAIDITWRPVRTPHFGAHIERLMRTVSIEAEVLDGATFSSPAQRGVYTPEKKATMTLTNLRRWLLQFFVNVYHQRKHAGIDMPPVERWRQGILGSGRQKGIGLPEPVPDPRRLRLDFLPYRSGVAVRSRGIVWDKIWYKHEVLKPWINAKRKVLVCRDPSDISRLYLLDPEQNEYFDVPYLDIGKPSISIWEYRAAQRQLAAKGVRNAGEDEIFAEREVMRRIEAQARKETKKVRRQREAKKHRAEYAIGPLSPPPAEEPRRDGTISLVIDNTGQSKRQRPQPPDTDFDFDDQDVKKGVEEW